MYKKLLFSSMALLSSLQVLAVGQDGGLSAICRSMSSSAKSLSGGALGAAAIAAAAYTCPVLAAAAVVSSVPVWRRIQQEREKSERFDSERKRLGLSWDQLSREERVARVIDSSRFSKKNK